MRLRDGALVECLDGAFAGVRRIASSSRQPSERRDPETQVPTLNMSRDPFAAAAADGDTLSEFANHADLHVCHSPPISTEPPRFGPAPLAEPLAGRLGPAVTFATTEHFNLQTARYHGR
jgi:hypothetical protein